MPKQSPIQIVCTMLNYKNVKFPQIFGQTSFDSVLTNFRLVIMNSQIHIKLLSNIYQSKCDTFYEYKKTILVFNEC